MEIFDLKKINKLEKTVTNIPDSWKYKYVLKTYYNRDISNLTFDGRSIKINSVFTEDKTPSMVFYRKFNTYKFKCFSSGKSGDAIDLVKEKKGKDFVYQEIYQELSKIFFDKYLNEASEEEIDIITYEKNLENYSLSKPFFIINSSLHKDDFCKKFIKTFKLEEKLFDKEDVRKITSYEIRNGEKWNKFQIQGFGFYKENVCVQIYIPGGKPKYITIDPKVIFGTKNKTNDLKDNITANTALIVSGMKDKLAFDSLKLNIDTYASASEIIILNKSFIEKLKNNYKYIFTFLDNDKTGIRMMQTYKSLYGIDFIYMPIKKDIADNNKFFEIDYLKEKYTVAINKKIEACLSQE